MKSWTSKGGRGRGTQNFIQTPLCTLFQVQFRRVDQQQTVTHKELKHTGSDIKFEKEVTAINWTPGRVDLMARFSISGIITDTIEMCICFS